MEGSYLWCCWQLVGTFSIIFYVKQWEYVSFHALSLPSFFLRPGLIIHEGSSVYRIFKRWQAVNQQWKVLNYEKSKDLGDPVSLSSKTGTRGSRGNPHGLASSSSGRQSRRLRTILNHHCGYTILHILSQLRPNDPRISSAANREVVMRVTTVWVGPDTPDGKCKWKEGLMDLILSTKDSHRQQEPCEEPSDARSINRQHTHEDFSSCFVQRRGSQMLLLNN